MSDKNRGSDGVDATLDGRVPIAGAPDAPPTGMSEATVQATVDRAVSTAITGVREDHRAEIDQLKSDSGRDQTLACLNTLISGNPGDDVDAMRFREFGIQDLVLQVHQGDKPHAELMTEANRLAREPDESAARRLAATVAAISRRLGRRPARPMGGSISATSCRRSAPR